MEPYIVWALVGLALVIVELLSGTFYLLMLGVACFGAAGVALAGVGFPLQSIVAVIVASVGAYGVHAYRARNRAEQMAPIDRGQPARFEAWIDQGAALARVQYRGATWDARVDGAAPLEAGATLYVLNANGNTLKVSKTPPG
jgi:membrane protein implicated in regulation of membrane protease activity